MLKHILPALAAVALSASSVAAQTASPGVSLTIRDGKVTLKAEQVSLRQILAEWERQGQVKVVGADKLLGAPVTLNLIDVPEKQALEIVMRGVPGYMAVDRIAQADAAPAGPSRYDRVVVMARAATPVPAVASAAPRGMPSPAQPPAAFQQTMPDAGQQAFMPPPPDDGAGAAGPERNDVEQFQQVEPPMPDAPVASPYPNAYPGSPYVGANGNAGPYGGNAAAAAAAGLSAAPPETQFDYANPQKYFEQRRLQQQGQQPPTAVPSAVPTIGTPVGTTGRAPATGADQRADGAGCAAAAGRRAGAARRADAGPGRVLQSVQPPRRLGAAARRARQRDAGRTRIGPSTATRTTAVAAARVTSASDRSRENTRSAATTTARPTAPGTTSRPISPSWPACAAGSTPLPPGTRVLDAGCGEGVLVEEFAGRLAIEGVDANYSSAHVQRGSLLALPFPDGRFTARCASTCSSTWPTRISRRRSPSCTASWRPAASCWSRCPNLAHLQSRVHFLLTGRLIRTANEVKHPGDRPLAEYRRLFERAGFAIVAEHGVFPTVPILTSWIRRKPADRAWLHTALTRLLPWPSLSFLAIVRLRRR